MNLINMNGSEDEGYRYKMPVIRSRYSGSGQFTKTIILNLEEISECIGHSKDSILKYLSYQLGTLCDMKEDSLNGSFSERVLLDNILGYLSEFIFCDSCNIPECSLIIDGKKKNIKMYKCCSACGSKNIYIPNKKMSKIYQYIIKNMENGVLYNRVKGGVSKEEDIDFDF